MSLTHAPSQPTTGNRVSSSELSLEARLAATDAAMTIRLEEAAVAHEVRTAHISTDPIDLGDVLTVPLTPTLQPPTRYRTPVAALLQRAHHRLLTDGWCTGAVLDAEGARCLYGAIRTEARGDRSLEAQGLQVLMDAIRRKFINADCVPSFNDSFASSRIPLRMLDQAAGLADTRGL
ncbi:hypothetical protein ACIRD0_37485 [Streptomyces microflavus]|uniref:DUF6197 family protein n=1 Tax=Streptomyces microflavus TaxID=1919 RepID=UPI0038062751